MQGVLDTDLDTKTIQSMFGGVTKPKISSFKDFRLGCKLIRNLSTMRILNF